MKFTLKALAAVAGLFSVFAAAVPTAAMAQKVAFYDHGKVVRESKAWKSLESQLKSKRTEIAGQLQPVADEVGKEGEAIQQLVSGMSPEDAQKKHGDQIREWQQKRAQLGAAQDRINTEFGIVAELAEAKINTVMADVFDDVAKKNRVDVVARQSGLGYYAAKYDVTDDVLAEVNNRLSTLSVEQLLEEVQQRQQQAQAAAQ